MRERQSVQQKESECSRLHSLSFEPNQKLNIFKHKPANNQSPLNNVRRQVNLSRSELALVG
jgi:hypothetical protein